MSNFFGNKLRLSVFGQSHSEAVGMTLEGVPAGKKIDFGALAAFLARRAPGRSGVSTTRREPDEPRFICGLSSGVTCGAPITAIIENTDARPSDYAATENVPRPGHADYTARVKFGGREDRTGGGAFSGRLTAPICVAGGICIGLLAERGVTVMARAYSIGAVEDEGEFSSPVGGKDFPTVSDARGREMKDLIAKARENGDSVGGVIECVVSGLPAGLGEPMFDGVENVIARAAFAVPGVKGIEFGAGFAAAKLYGSENNDAFGVENGAVVTKTNNCGGILGGITTGMPVVFRAAVKPTPSIAKTQNSVDLSTMTETRISVSGRHDPCIVPRAVPCVEACAALAVADLMISENRL